MKANFYIFLVLLSALLHNYAAFDFRKALSKARESISKKAEEIKTQVKAHLEPYMQTTMEKLKAQAEIKAKEVAELAKKKAAEQGKVLMEKGKEITASVQKKVTEQGQQIVSKLTKNINGQQPTTPSMTLSTAAPVTTQNPTMMTRMMTSSSEILSSAKKQVNEGTQKALQYARGFFPSTAQPMQQQSTVEATTAKTNEHQAIHKQIPATKYYPKSKTSAPLAPTGKRNRLNKKKWRRG